MKGKQKNNTLLKALNTIDHTALRTNECRGQPQVGGLVQNARN